MIKTTRYKRLLTGILLIALLLTFSGCHKNESIESTTQLSSETSEATTTPIVESTTEAILQVDDVLEIEHELWVKENAQNWDLGFAFIDYVGNNRDYDWYIDQAHTGEHSNDNCGPASVTMAIKWADASFSKTAEEARKKYISSGGWWTTDEIADYLDDYDIEYMFFDMPVDTKDDNIRTIMSIIDSGNIALACTEMKYIPLNDTADTRVNRFYEFDSGHFFIIKGYAIVDNYTYFEVYDPNNWDETYADGALKGKDRFYEANTVVDAISYWWPYVFSIYPEND